ncbi:MAG TPA: hypothetical protein VFP93_04260, partial [Gammaproteobacteria bacterium]|nr:hypothetical protein [Gammaproteobacteria bacterium]
LKNTRVTMADIVLVALGLQFRAPKTEEKFQELRKKKYKELEELPGDQFFAKSPSIELRNESNQVELIQESELIQWLNSRDRKEQLPFLQETFEQFEQTIKNQFVEKLQYLGTLTQQDEQAKTAYGVYKPFLTQHNFAKPILDCLAGEKYIYDNEDQQKALLIACLNASVTWEKLKKAILDVQKEIDGALQRIAAQKAALDRLSNVQVNQHNSDLFAIRQSIKLDLLGDEQIEESEKQKALLDKLARHIFQQRYPEAILDAEDAILEEVQNKEAAIEKVKDKIAVEKVRGTEEEVQRLQETLKKLEEENAMLKLELEALQKIQQEFVHNKEELARNKDELAQNQQELEIHKKLLANAQDELLCFKVIFEEQQQELMISTKDLANQKEQLHQVQMNLELQQKELEQSTFALSQQTALLSQTTVELEEQRKQLHNSRSVLEKQSNILQENKAAFQHQAMELEKSKAILLEQNREIAKNKALLEQQQADLGKNKTAMQKQFVDLELKAAEVEENKRLLAQTQQALKSKQVELDKLKNTTYTPAMNMVRKETPAEVYLRTKSVDEMFGCAAHMGYKTLEPLTYLAWMNVNRKDYSSTKIAVASQVWNYNATAGECFKNKYHPQS